MIKFIIEDFRYKGEARYELPAAWIRNQNDKIKAAYLLEKLRARTSAPSNFIQRLGDFGRKYLPVIYFRR